MPLNLHRIRKSTSLTFASTPTPLSPDEPRHVDPEPSDVETQLAEAFLAARYEWARGMADTLIARLEAGQDPGPTLPWDKLQASMYTHMAPILTAQIRSAGAEQLGDDLPTLVQTQEERARVLEQARQARDRSNLAFASGAGGGAGIAVSPPPASTPNPGRFEMQLRLDLVNPYAVRYATTHVLDLAGRVSMQAQQAIAETIRRAVMGEMDSAAAARQIYEVLGLHPRWANAVRNYEGRLQKGGKFSPAQVEGKVRKYAQTLRRKRATMVARTEIMRAANYGRLASWDALAGMGMLDLNASVKEWSVGIAFAEGEGKLYGHKVVGPCAVCKPMEGKRVGMREKFTLPNFRQLDAPPGHPHCRCVVKLIPPELPEDARGR